jgi:hypothetical protein
MDSSGFGGPFHPRPLDNISRITYTATIAEAFLLCGDLRVPPVSDIFMVGNEKGS